MSKTIPHRKRAVSEVPDDHEAKLVLADAIEHAPEERLRHVLNKLLSDGGGQVIDIMKEQLLIVESRAQVWQEGDDMTATDSSAEEDGDKEEKKEDDEDDSEEDEDEDESDESSDEDKEAKSKKVAAPKKPQNTNSAPQAAKLNAGRKASDVTSTSKRLRPRYAICERCDEEFDTTQNDRAACRWHDGRPFHQPYKQLSSCLLIIAGEREPDYEHETWWDWDEAVHGNIADMEDELPEGFIWTCCDRAGTKSGCMKGRHKEPEYVSAKRRKLSPLV